MNSEITDIKDENGWVCFDSDCALCLNLARRLYPLLHRHGFSLLPLQTRWVRELLADEGQDLLAELRLITPEGRIHGGAGALIEIARKIWWAKPAYWVFRLPPARLVLTWSYRWLARYRTCVGGNCSAVVPRRPWRVSTLGWALGFLRVILAVRFGRTLPGWVWMWALAAALFATAKWMTLLRLTNLPRRIGYCILNTVFACLPVIYLLAAWRGGRP